MISVLTNHVRKGGRVITLAPNLYHSMFFNLSIGRLEESEYVLKNSMGKFTAEMPYIHFFTPDSISRLYKEAGLTIEKLSGFPVTIYPNFQETQISGSTKSLSDLLSDKSNFDRIYTIEKKLIENTDLAARGNNIYIVGKK